MPTTAILELQLKADSLETAHEVIHATLTGTRAFPGCLDVTVLIDSDDPAHVCRSTRTGNRLSMSGPTARRWPPPSGASASPPSGRPASPPS